MKKSIFTVALSLALMSGYANTSMETGSSHQPFSCSNHVKKESINSFCKAIMQGNVEAVRQLIGLGEDINQKSLGKTPAMYAARYNKAEILELLIEKGADLSLKSDKEKYTAKKFAELSNAQDALAVIEANSKK